LRKYSRGMNPEIRYIELKSGFSDDGPAWIGSVSFSRTGRTAYFNGKGFKHAGKGHYSDLETGENYWISGIKKNGEDRHWAGTGRVMIQRDVVQDYLNLIGATKLDMNKFELVDVKETDIQRLTAIENETIEKGMDFDKVRFKKPENLSDDELDFLIDEYHSAIETAKFNKGRRSFERARLGLIEERGKREKRATTTGDTL